MTNTKPKLNPMLKLALDIGPLILFFAANARFGIFAATASFMVAIVVALGVSYALTRHLPVMPLVTAILVLIFGGVDAGAARRAVHQGQADHHLRAVRGRTARAGSRSASRCSAWCSIRCST